MLYLKDIIKTFPGREQPILNKVSLQLVPGEFCVLVGSNGSGKSSLLKAISGEILHDSGEIYLGRQEISSLPQHLRANSIGSVVQDIHKGTIGEMTLFENLSLSALRGKRARLTAFQQNDASFKKLLATFGNGLERYGHTPMKNLSGGQRQVVALAMALMQKPQLLLLDEHCSALDPATCRMLMEHTQRAVEEHCVTTLMITHNLPDALAYGGRILLMQEGEIVHQISQEDKKKLCTGDLYEILSERRGMYAA